MYPCAASPKHDVRGRAYRSAPRSRKPAPPARAPSDRPWHPPQRTTRSSYGPIGETSTSTSTQALRPYRRRPVSSTPPFVHFVDTPCPGTRAASTSGQRTSQGRVGYPPPHPPNDRGNGGGPPPRTGGSGSSSRAGRGGASRIITAGQRWRPPADDAETTPPPPRPPQSRVPPPPPPRCNPSISSKPTIARQLATRPSTLARRVSH